MSQTSNPERGRYSPEDQKYGLYMTLGLIAVLSVMGILGAAVGAVASGLSEQAGSVEESGSADSGSSESGSSGAESSPEATTGPPSDMSELCYVNNPGEEISSEERGAVKSEAEDFVMTLWGDPGSDSDEYRASIEQRVVGECIWDSPQASLVNDREEIAYEGGATSAPEEITSDDGSTSDLRFASEFLTFEPTSIGALNEPSNFHPERSGSEYVGVAGEAIWISEKAGGGGKQAYQQQLTLVKPKDGGEWQVSNMGSAYDYIDPEYQDELPPGVDEY